MPLGSSVRCYSQELFIQGPDLPAVLLKLAQGRMVLIGLLAVLAAPSETWFCTLNADVDSEGYQSTYVVSDNRVIETGLMAYGYEILEDNSDHLTFARSQYNAMLNAGFRLDQLAVVVTIDRSTNGVKKIFLQDHGERTSIQRGTCQWIEV